jgi:hypothetical protein
MNIRADETNYWPGYVDALINVVLNLLFLTSVFAVGFVSLNADLFAAAQKVAEAKAREIMALRDGLVLQDHDTPLRARASARTLALIQAPNKSVQLAPSLAPAPTREPQVLVHELRFLSSPSESVTRLGVATDNASLDGSISVELGQQRLKRVMEYAEKLVDLHVLGKVVFEHQQFELPRSQVLPVLDASDPADGWTLLVMTDKDNPRLMREAFERLTSVRASYLRSGLDPRKFQLRIKSTPSDMADAIGIEDLVWVLKSQPVRAAVKSAQ